MLRLALAVLVVGALLARRALDVVEVRGRSMAPALLPGDRLLVMRLAGPPRAGEIVLAHDPRDPTRELVKRVASVTAAGVALRGDNPFGSTDARTFGMLDRSAVGWRVVWRYWPVGRIGRLTDAAPRDAVDEGGESACAVPEALIAGG